MYTVKIKIEVNMESKKVILLRYGELFLKGKNRNLFEKRLIENIKKALIGVDYKFIRTQIDIT